MPAVLRLAVLLTGAAAFSPHAVGFLRLRLREGIAPQLVPALESLQNELYPTASARYALYAQYVVVVLGIGMLAWSSRRRKAAQPEAQPPNFFIGDLSEVHTLEVLGVGSLLSTGVSGKFGLAEEEVAVRTRAFGPNVLTPPERGNHFIMLLKQVFGGLFNIMLWICVAAETALAVWFDGDDFVTPSVLSCVIVASGVLQWWTELKAEILMASLQAMAEAPKVRVLRGTDESVDASELVPGDVILLEAGEKVPADIRVIKCTDGTEVDNSALTGESAPEPRHARADDAPQMQARNMAFLGTTVQTGRLTGVVIFTGDRTVLGSIAQSISRSRPRSSLEIQIEHFVHIIAAVAMAVGLLSCAANCLSPMKRSWARILENSATAFFAQVPEGLLPTVTISLMIGANKMTTRKVLVRKMDAVETLGCVSVLCSDKTGTLTSGTMTLTDLVPMPHFKALEKTLESDSRAMQALMDCCVLNNAAKGNDGSPTELAILVGVERVYNEAAGRELRPKLDVAAFRASRELVFEIPFNSENKWAMSVHAVGEHYLAILKGAPERVFSLCVDGDGTQAEVACSDLMRLGRRVLGYASCLLDLPAGFAFSGTGAEDLNCAMPFEFVGLVGLEDPPKPGVKEAIRSLKLAGVKTVMVTGDHPTTAQAIAERIGICEDEQENTCVTGISMQSMLPTGENFGDDPPNVQDFWRDVVQHARIFARVSPNHKRVIVQAYQTFGDNIVAMTGDGVNDAPALKQAEVGVAMGIRGTEVAKEAADIVLLDDNLMSVVAGTEQGRLCSENLRKSILYTLCSKLPQVIPTFVELLGVPTALTTAQVLLIDIGTDIWTAIAFAWQPAEKDLMSVPPRHPRKERMVTPRVLAYSYGYIGVLQMLACFFVFFYAVPAMATIYERGEFKHFKDYTAADLQENYRGMTAYYWTLVLGQVAAAMATTTTRESLFSYGLPNMMLNLCIVLEIVLALAIIYWPAAESTFKTSALDMRQLAWGALGFVVIFCLEEVRKFMSQWQQILELKRKCSKECESPRSIEHEV